MSHTLEERCRQLMIQRKFEQCQKEIETAMAENPHCAIPHNLMGILLEKESNHVLAMKHFRAAYALDLGLLKTTTSSQIFKRTN